MEDILDILNISSLTQNQLGTLDGDDCVFDGFNDLYPYEADISEDVLWTNEQGSHTQNDQHNLNTDNVGQVQGDLNSQISNVCGYENPAINEADLMLCVEGDNIQQVLDMDMDFTTSYGSEVLSQLPDALVETREDVITDYGNDLAGELAVQCSELWHEPAPVPAYQSIVDLAENFDTDLSVPLYTNNEQDYYFDSVMDHYIESDTQAGAFGGAPESPAQSTGAANQDKENLDIENDIHNIDPTITLHLLDDDEYEKRIVSGQHQTLYDVILPDELPEPVESSQNCGETSVTEVSKCKPSTYKNADSDIAQNHIRYVSKKLDKSTEDELDFFTDVEMDDPNDQDYCPTEIDMMMEMGLGPNIYNNVSERQKGYKLRPRSKRNHKKLKDVRDLRDVNDDFIVAQNESNKSVAKCRKLVSELRNSVYSKVDKRSDEHIEASEKENILISQNVVEESEINNDALKQLLSLGIRKTLKQHKIIMFQGEDPKCGRTVQKINVVDPTIKCIAKNDDTNNRNEVAVEKHPDLAMKKKYQCGKCDKAFEELSSFKEHNKCTAVNRHQGDYEDSRFLCTQCGKTLKNQDELEMHRRRHGDPEVECQVCHKVFATKAILRTHRRLHERPYSCDICHKSFNDVEKLRKHKTKNYCTYKYDDVCDNDESGEHTKRYCNLKAGDASENHVDGTSENDDVAKSNVVSSNTQENNIDVVENVNRIDTENSNSLPLKAVKLNDTAKVNSTFIEVQKDILTSKFRAMMQKDNILNHDVRIDDNVKKADAMMAKVMETDIFLKERGEKSKYHDKVCNVCGKTFGLVSGLKRHLIEHVIRANLLKTPVGRDGTLCLQCEICRVESFTKIDKYKAHLREHAKFTLYQCKFCDKSFSDSSNFSKHRKVHGAASFQCDLCQKKFNSKKMITKHMEYHSNTEPILCQYCDKVFHFEPSLKKHLNLVHNRNKTAQFRCKLCHQYFRSIKEKLDHEWIMHSVRKMVADCVFCDKKFRKNSELYRHYKNTHDTMMYAKKK